MGRKQLISFNCFLRSKRNVAAGIFSLSLLLSSCSAQLGFQGGYIPEDFKGITLAEAVSPDSVRLAWSSFKGASNYSIYSFGYNDALYESQFSEFILQPESPRTPERVYRYSVTATDPITGLQIGNKAAYASVSVLPRFNFREKGSVENMNNNTSLRVTWEGFPGVTYKVYAGEKDSTGRVNYDGFINASATVIGASQAVINNLKEGKEYCFVAIALYGDNSTDGPNGVPFPPNSVASSALTSLLTGENGKFNSSAIANSQKCKRTTSGFTIGNIEVLAPKATLSVKPTFRVEGVPTNFPPSVSIETSIYRIEPNEDYATYVGKRIGSGNLQSVINHSPGKYQYYAIIAKKDTQSQETPEVRAEIKLESNLNQTISDSNRHWIHVRNIGGTVTPSAQSCNTNPDSSTIDSGCYPEKQQLGMGPQKLGSSVAMGDFNCDGRYDLAVGISDFISIADDGRPALLGKVLVYYDVVNGTPTLTSKKQDIIFDLTSMAGDKARNLRLGTFLLADNFNGDNGQTNQNGSVNDSAYQCHDLVIGSGLGPIFVLYGKRKISEQDWGGLNYTSPTAFAVNPTASCDPGTGVCQASAIVQNGASRVVDGEISPTGNDYFKISDITTGDFNGDGYPEISLVSKYTTSFYGDINHSIWTYRGSEFGLLPPYLSTTSNCSGASPVLSFPTGPRQGFPIISYMHWWLPGALCSDAPVVNLNGRSGYGGSIGSMPNSAYDFNSQRVKDRLIIGNGYTSFACYTKGPVGKDLINFPIESKDTLQDPANPTHGWDCSVKVNDVASNHPLKNVTISGAMVGIKNALRYVPNSLPENGNDPSNPNSLGQPGALAISNTQKRSNASGTIYVYYGLANPKPTIMPSTGGSNVTFHDYCSGLYNPASATRNYRGCLLNEYITWLFKYQGAASGDATTTVTTNPCPISTTTPATATFEEPCRIQRLTHPANADGGFGAMLSVLPGNLPAETEQSAKDKMLATTLPYRTINSGGNTYSNVGSAQVFRMFNFNPQTPGKVLVPSVGPSVEYLRHSNGFSNNLSFSIDYLFTPVPNTLFGLGGIAGGPTGTPISNNYNSQSDIALGAPGYSIFEEKNNKTAWIYDNGGTFLYYSHDGTYRNYRTDQTVSDVADFHEIKYNPSPENTMNFHQVVSIGDINKDGAVDFATRISQGAKNKVRVYYGSTNGYHLNHSYTDISVSFDSSAGLRIIPLGNIRLGSNFPALMITGDSGSYIYFSGINGITLGTPTYFATGGVPRRMPGKSLGGLSFSDQEFANPESPGNIDSNIEAMKGITIGDFNGDGYNDLAFTRNSPIPVHKGSGITDTFPANLMGSGSIMILYGGADNGFQLQANENAQILNNEDFFAVLENVEDNVTPSAPVAANPIATLEDLKNRINVIGTANSSTKSIYPCDSVGRNCRGQVIFASTPKLNYGRTITSVPIGSCNSGTSETTVHALVVSSNTDEGLYLQGSLIEYYVPRCILEKGTNPNLETQNLSGLVPVPILVERTAPAIHDPGLGTNMTYVPKMLGPQNKVSGHLAVSYSNWNQPLGQTGASKQYIIKTYPIFAPSDLSVAAPTCTTAAALSAMLNPYSINSSGLTSCGGQTINYSTSSLMGDHSINTVEYNPGFATGLVSPNDMNGDGFGDLVIGISKLARKEPGKIVPAQGGMVVLFGGENGLQAYNGATLIEPSKEALCYKEKNKLDITCNPALVYLPQPNNSTRDGAFDRLYISPFNGFASPGANFGGLGSVVIGVPYRDTTDPVVGDRILNAGAFYILK